MKTPSLLCGLALAAGLTLCAPLAAQTAPGTPRAEVSAKAVEQKAQMVDRLIFNSPVAARVGSSKNDEARRHFNNAREYYTHGKALAGSGQLRGADLLLNEAIWELSRAQTLVPDQATRMAGERSRYQQLKGSVDALLRTYELGVTGPGAITLSGDSPAERNVKGAMAQVEQARVLSETSKLVEANSALEKALALLLKDALGRIDGKTVVYDRRFTDVKQEFAYELERQRSYDSLVPLAVLEYRPSKEAVALIDRYVQSSRSLRAKAEAQAAANDHAQAVQTLNEATDALQRALLAAGLSVPQTMATQ
ncbi:hypothetical protein BurJ1DRAFT_4169 [Burkholderiales bacterium JOSHI_001]|nr:hypothetical protein BurJ1DRAFT_4169 [Burkholderiales bacterium JOSHI_001]